MTYCRNKSMVCWEVITGLEAHGWQPVGVGLTQNNFRPHAAFGVNLQKQRMPEATVDHVRLADAVAQAVEASLHFRDHAFVYDATVDQVAAAGIVEMAHQGFLVSSVQEDAG